jgi:TetR/AcrR family transcriptional repressor of nem operon
MTATSNNTKERLIITAMDLIRKSSYGAVSVDGICKAADVKKGSFYHFFPSKIDLSIAAMEEAFAKFRPMLEEIFSPDFSPVERFERYADFGYESQKNDLKEYGMVCGCPFVSLASEMAPQNESIRNKTNEIMSQHCEYYKTTLRDMVTQGLLPKDTDIDAKTNKIYTFIIGLLVMARIQNSLEPMKRDLKTGLFRIIGIKNQTNQSTAY